MPLEFRAYEPGDESNILRLFALVYKKELDPAIWLWRFTHALAGRGVIDLAWDGTGLAAHYAVTSVPMRLFGSTVATGLSGTTMTHANYRGQGLFPQLARRTYARMADEGYGMVWGFPNDQSHRGFIRDLEWRDVYEIPTFRLVLPAARLPAEPAGVAEVSDVDERFDRLWEEARDVYEVMVQRDRAYLRWRYVQNPTESYRFLTCAGSGGQDDGLAGYAVFKRYQSELQIVDLLTRRDPAAGLRLVSQVIRLAEAEGATAVSLWLNVTDPLHLALESAGFRNGLPVTYLCALRLRSDVPESGLYSYRNWYYTMGDSDVF